MIQGKRDVNTVLAMGVMDDVSIIPQPDGDTGKIDLTMNVVERKSGGGISGGGGISSGITSGPLAGLSGSIAIYHKNLFGRNQKLNLSLERGQIDSIFRINYTDPWIEGDDKRTSREIMIQNSRTPIGLQRKLLPEQVPLGNFEVDWLIHTTDIFLSRALHDQQQVLWISDNGIPDLGGIDEEVPCFIDEVNQPVLTYPGAYRKVTVELKIHQLAVNALLKSNQVNEMEGGALFGLDQEPNISENRYC